MPRAEDRPDLIPVAEQIRLRKAGFKISFIAKKAGRSSSTMVRRFQRWGVVPDEDMRQMFTRRKRGSKLDGQKDRIKHLHHDQKLSTRQIAAIMDVSPQTVLNFMYRHEIEVRSQRDAIHTRFETAPPKRVATSSSFTPERAKEVSTAYWKKRRKMDELNARKRAARKANGEEQAA